MHKGLEERVFQVRDDGAEWVDVPRVDQLLRSAQLDRVDERSHQVARWQDPLHDDQQVRVDLQQAVAFLKGDRSIKCSNRIGHQPSPLPPPSPSPECRFPKWLPIIIVIIIVIIIISSISGYYHQCHYNHNHRWLPDRAQVGSRSSGPSQPPTGCPGTSLSTSPDLFLVIFEDIELNLQNLESTSPQDTRPCTRVLRH